MITQIAYRSRNDRPGTRQAERSAQDLNDLARSLAGIVEQYKK